MLDFQCHCITVCQFDLTAHTSVSAVQVDDYKLTERGVVGLKNLGNTVIFTD